MGLLNKRQAVKDQIEIKELLPDQAVVTRLKKQMTAVESAVSKYKSKMGELEKQVEALSLAEETFSTSEKGFDGAEKAINALFTARKTYSTEDITEQKQYYSDWMAAYVRENLEKVVAELDLLLNLQASRLQEIELEFETSKNSAELDEVHALLTVECKELYEQLTQLAKNKHPLTSKNVYTVLSTTKLPERNSLADKQKKASAEGAKDRTAQIRKQEATDAWLISQGMKPFGTDWI